MDNSELSTWRITALILGVVSIAIFLVQRSRFMFLDPVFEFAIFHVPAILALNYYIVVDGREGAKLKKAA